MARPEASSDNSSSVGARLDATKLMMQSGASQLALESEAMVGVAATLGIATLSGFAAVYTERVLKRGGGPAAHGKHMLANFSTGIVCASLRLALATAP